MVVIQSSKGLSGNLITEFIETTSRVVTDFVDTASGQKASREAIAAQTQLAKLQADRLASQTASRAKATEQLFKSLPGIAIGVGAIIALAIFLRKK